MQAYAYLPPLLEGVWLLLFFDTLMQPRFRKRWIAAICIPLATVLLAGLMYGCGVSDLFLKSLLSCAASFLLVCLFYRAPVLQKLFAVVISNPLLGIFDVLGIAVFQTFFGATMEAIVASTAAAIAVKSVAVTCVLIFRFVMQRNREAGLLTREWVLLAFFTTLILFVAINIARVDVQRQRIAPENVWNEIALVVLLYLVFVIIHSLSQRHRLEKRMALLQQQVEEQQRSVQALAETHKAIRCLSHDFQDQLTCIRGYLEGGDTDAALRFLRSVSGKAEHRILPVHSNNVAIDALLNEKYLLGSRYGITFRYAVRDLSQMPIPDIDVATILANALNNAIEACQKVKGRRHIYVQIGTVNGKFLIDVQNPVAGPVKITENHIASTKADRVRHGVGLSNVQMVVAQNHGDLFLSCEEGEFDFLAIFES